MPDCPGRLQAGLKAFCIWDYQMQRYLPKTARTKGLVECLDSLEPKLHTISAAVAFIDLSGFVSGSYVLENQGEETGTGESVRQVLNRFMSTLVQEVDASGGDTLKFAGALCFV